MEVVLDNRNLLIKLINEMNDLDMRQILAYGTVIIPDVAQYRDALHEAGAQLKSFYLTYDYERNITNLNLVVLLREGIDSLKVLGSLEHIYPTRSITLANQLNI